MIVDIPGRELRTVSDLHRAFEAALDLGPYYGRNINALYDRLSRDVERPVHVVWRDVAASRAALGSAVVDDYLDILATVAREDGHLREGFTFETHEGA